MSAIRSATLTPSAPRSRPAWVTRAPLVATCALALAAGPGGAAAQQGAVGPAVAEWRAGNERRIVDEFLGLLALPNVAREEADMRRNADHLAEMFRRRGFQVELGEGAGPPVVLARLPAENPRGTITLYIHYDGQAVDPAEWTHCGPFDPCVVGPSGKVALDASLTRFDPEWRVYGRSASDDKGPIMATLAAVDALRAIGAAPAWSLVVVLDGQEEAGSANFRRFARERGELLRGDLALTLDGPRHPSGRPTLYYGVRGGATVTLTVFTAKGDLHSGNYGNWAPDPSIRLGRLLASMKDEDGRVLIDGFYDDVTPLTATEREALAAMPSVEASLARTFGIAEPERPAERLEAKLNQPTLNVLAMEAGGGLSAPGRTAIPAFAAARVAMRLVQGIDPEKQVGLVVAHVRKQGYHVVENRGPTDEERLAHPLLARIDGRGGSRASRVSMDEPMTRKVAAVLTRDGVPPVRLPTLGGSMPFGELSDGLGMPTVGVSLVNHDNNQHGPDENLRLQNLWEGIELLAGIMTMPR
jgi:acetylornithine deacetylase/succinyl-diaminopimelate desuccinylase-like protein